MIVLHFAKMYTPIFGINFPLPCSPLILCSISVDENHELLKYTGCRYYGRKMSPVYIFEIDVDAISGIEL